MGHEVRVGERKWWCGVEGEIRGIKVIVRVKREKIGRYIIIERENNKL